MNVLVSAALLGHRASLPADTLAAGERLRQLDNKLGERNFAFIAPDFPVRL